MSAKQSLDFNTVALQRLRAWRGIKDQLAAGSVKVGGISVILTLLLILCYLFYEAAPLFQPASVQKPITIATTLQNQPQYFAIEEQGQLATRISDQGKIDFVHLTTKSFLTPQYIALPNRASITAVFVHNHVLGLGLSNGQLLLVQIDYVISYDADNAATVTPQLRYPYGQTPLAFGAAENAVQQLVLVNQNDALLIAGYSANEIIFKAFSVQTNMLTAATQLQEVARHTLPATATLASILIDTNARWLYLPQHNGTLTTYQITPAFELQHHSNTSVSVNTVTAANLLLGGNSLLIGDDKGTISQWFMVRDKNNNHRLEKVRDFHLDEAVKTLIPEQRRKGFIALGEHTLGIFYTTSERTLLKETIFKTPAINATLSSRGDQLVTEDAQHQLANYFISNKHPEVSWSSLWQPVWYEGYETSDYIWQSSAATTDFEPKFSLMPLVFGTLKAALYAMLFAIPLAIAGAIYTAYFMTPKMRGLVKPTIELMQALPTVILGFLAGLWLAPLLEEYLASVFLILLIIPIFVFITALLWNNLPIGLRHRASEGWHAALLIPAVILAIWLAFALSHPVEQWLFAGNIRQWLTEELGLRVDQRNALVVGIAMGFAVIPTIFSIAEDAIFGVPKQLTYGSLALGATPWQSLWRVILPTASPGIFSGVMIGLGRAVGETMIVLMAAGNTPLMDFNLFEGLRALSANIAVEMPEAEVNSTHFRILFLSGLVLFLFTFILNTMADVVRQRLRKKYSTL